MTATNRKRTATDKTIAQKQESKRPRPTHDLDERSRKAIILDEMEAAAQNRLKDGADRIPLDARLKLDWSQQDPNYAYFWASDSDTYPVKLQDMLNAGYTFVRHNHGQRHGEQIIVNSRGCNLYLMRQPREIFERDEAEKHKKSRELMNEVNQVGEREYAGKSKELGKGKTVELDFVENPDTKNLNEQMGN